MGDAALVRDAKAAFQTDHLSYTLVTTALAIEGDLAVVFTNRMGGPVFFVNCNGATSLILEQQVGDQWVQAWGPVTPAGLVRLNAWACEWCVTGVSRLHSTLATGGITSKEAAGMYALATFPVRWQRVIEEALRIRRAARGRSLYRSPLDPPT